MENKIFKSIILSGFLLFLSQCLTFYERIPNVEEQILQESKISNAQSKSIPPTEIKEPIKFWIDLPIEEGKTFGKLQYDSIKPTLELRVKDFRERKNNSFSFFCMLSGLTLTILPCYKENDIEIKFDINTTLIFEKDKSVTQLVKQKEFVWFPFILVSAFIGDKSPEAGDLIALEEAQEGIIKEANPFFEKIAKKRKDLKPILRNSKAYPVLLNDFATTDSSSSYFQIGSGRDLLIQVYNNSTTAIKSIAYEVVSTNNIYQSNKETTVTITNTEDILPGDFSKNTYYKDKNPKPHSFSVYMDSMKVTWENGKVTTISPAQISKVNLHVPSRMILDLNENKN
ncbi:MAG: hypothetical protein GW938_04000 [Leptospira sp.]|nr:hypothetical protein [Leptospira sp.]NCS94607.1 hypothetical protein [Leptospira sp.]